MPYHFYILHSKTQDRHYIGSTSNLEDRVRKHNSNHKGFTGSNNDWALVYSELYSTKDEACMRERKVN